MSNSNCATLYPLGLEGLSPISIPELLTLGKQTVHEQSLRDLSLHEGLADRHCRIEQRKNKFWIRDLRSGLPTFVNDLQVSERALKENDEIRIGTVRFIFSQRDMAKSEDPTLLSKNRKWQAQLRTLPDIAATNYSVMILGPSGSGKEVIAHKIHQLSDRSHGPFVSVNCCALTESLIESELFGHVRGSFTGAIADRKGAFEAARGGTLFLDEIGDLSYSLQAKLLRAIENQEIRPLGSDQNVNTDVRILTATHQNLPDKIHLKQFRADLYFRLNVITVKPPALVDRMEDFEDLLYHFAKDMKVPFSHNAIQRLKHHLWPGNIRELKNTVARAAALYPRQLIEDQHVRHVLDPASITEPSGQVHVPGDLPVVREFERDMIIKRLLANRGNQRQTATDLGIPKSTLHDRLRRYKINAKHYKMIGGCEL